MTPKVTYVPTVIQWVENGKIDVVSKTLTRIYAAKGSTKIRLRNQNEIQNKKQIRVKSIKIVYFK